MRKSKLHKSFLKKLYSKKDPNAVVGIYKIDCTKTKKFYVGSSVDINKRWEVYKFELDLVES